MGMRRLAGAEPTNPYLSAIDPHAESVDRNRLERVAMAWSQASTTSPPDVRAQARVDGGFVMRTTVVLAVVLLAATQSAMAANANGNGALALAALVSESSPQVSQAQKRVMVYLLNGNLAFNFPAG